MNEVINNMITRRSVKKYKPLPVAKELIEEIVKAGTYAPSGKNLQAAKIIAVTSKSLRDRLSRMNSEILGVNSDPFYGAPVVLVVLGDMSIPTRVYDGSIVMENLMLAAHSLGLGSCWIHRAKQEFESEEGKAILKELGIEGEWEGIGHCIIGYAEDNCLKPQRERKADYVVWAE